MANANSTASDPSIIKDKFHAVNYAICQASFIAHFLASAVSKHIDAEDSVSLDSTEAEGLLVVVRDLVGRIESKLSLLDECERAANHG